MRWTLSKQVNFFFHDLTKRLRVQIIARKEARRACMHIFEHSYDILTR
jgi:hypothetical protein